MNEMLEINVCYCFSQSSLQKNSSEGIDDLPILVLVIEDLKMNALLHIGGSLIRCLTILKALHTSYYRAAKKPTKAKWFLGDEYEIEIDIECKGVVPRMAWRMSNKIKRWEITWKDSMPTNPDVSLGINGDLGLAIMMSHRMTLLALARVDNEMWPDALAALVAVHLIRPGDGDDDYIAVVLDATFCHMELCAEAQEKGLQFPEGFADECEDVMVTFSTVEAAMEQVMKERPEVAAKPTKRSCPKKSDAAVGVQEASDKIAVTGESSRSKRKSTSGSAGREALRGKKSEGKLTLAVVIV